MTHKVTLPITHTQIGQASQGMCPICLQPTYFVERCWRPGCEHAEVPRLYVPGSAVQFVFTDHEIPQW